MTGRDFLWLGGGIILGYLIWEEWKRTNGCGCKKKTKPTVAAKPQPSPTDLPWEAN